jgi:hypothetical protein
MTKVAKQNPQCNFSNLNPKNPSRATSPQEVTEETELLKNALFSTFAPVQILVGQPSFQSGFPVQCRRLRRQSGYPAGLNPSTGGISPFWLKCITYFFAPRVNWTLVQYRKCQFETEGNKFATAEVATKKLEAR